MSNWNQPLCERCWFTEHDGLPVRYAGRLEAEQCCMCGWPTVAGIYVRRDPAFCNFPAQGEG